MKILLDTCKFLWLVSGDVKLSAAVRDPNNQVFLSAVSFREISGKSQPGKLPLPEPPAQFIPQPREIHLIESLASSDPLIRQYPVSLL